MTDSQQSGSAFGYDKNIIVMSPSASAISHNGNSNSKRGKRPSIILEGDV